MGNIKLEEKVKAMLTSTLRLVRVVEHYREHPLSDTEIEILSQTISDLFVGRTVEVK